MDHWLEFLDEHHEKLLSFAAVSRTVFSRGQPVEVEQGRLQQLSELLVAFLETRAKLTHSSETAKADGYYTLSLAPTLQRQALDDPADFTQLAEKYIAQARHQGTGQIIGIGLARDIFADAIHLTRLPGPQALAAVVAVTLVLDALDSINVMQGKLDTIQHGIDALLARAEAHDDAQLTTALKETDRVQHELTEPGLTEADRREARQRIQGSWQSVELLMSQDKKRLRDLACPRKQEKGNRRLPELPVSVQFPVKRRTSGKTDETLPLFSRLLRGLVIKTRLLTVLKLTELRRGVQQRERELQAEIGEIQTLHREFRLLWAQSAETIQEYGVNVNAQFEVAEQLQTLAQELERLRVQPAETKTLVLQAGSNGKVVGVAMLPPPYH